MTSTVDLSKLPAPAIIETVDYDALLDEMVARLKADAPDLAQAVDLESEPMRKLLRVVAYYRALDGQNFNDRARGNLLALAKGADLDHLAAFYGVERLEVQAADPDARPPIPQIMETDAALRARTQQALEGFSTAGPRGAYEFHARSASGLVTDVYVVSPSPREVVISVLSSEADGTPSAATLALVAAAVNDEKVRPLTDHVTVNACGVRTFQVRAALELLDGPDQTVVLAAARDSLDRYLLEIRALGRDVELSALYAALHVPGVKAVNLISPTASVDILADQVAHATAVEITVAGGN